MLRFFPEPDAVESQFRHLARTFAEKEVAPTLRADEVTHTCRKDLFQKAAKLGLSAVTLPKEWGGGGASSRAHYAVIEELAAVSTSFAVMVAVTNLPQGALSVFGTPEQKKKYLPRLISGEWLGAFSLSESGAGSDSANLRCTATKTKGGYLLNGTKLWCSNAGYADLYLLMARTGEAGGKGISAFLVEANTPGFRVGKQERKLGLKTSGLAELILENCFIPESNLIGKEGGGLGVALSQLDAGRIAIGAVGVGVARACLNAYFLEKISHEDRFAKYYAQLQAVKSLIHVASDLRDQKGDFIVVASQIKLMGSDLAMNIASDVLEALGERAYLEGEELTRHFCDAKALQIVEGTNQIQCLVLTRNIERMFTK